MNEEQRVTLNDFYYNGAKISELDADNAAIVITESLTNGHKKQAVEQMNEAGLTPLNVADLIAFEDTEKMKIIRALTQK